VHVTAFLHTPRRHSHFMCSIVCRYFRFTGTTLPLQFNTQADQSLVGNFTVGGISPKVVHFTQIKPFQGPQPGAPGHQFLCDLLEIDSRATTAFAIGRQRQQQQSMALQPAAE
jgi:hypothetical protein